MMSISPRFGSVRRTQRLSRKTLFIVIKNFESGIKLDLPKEKFTRKNYISIKHIP